MFQHIHLHNCTLRKKGTKAVTGALPFQKVNFCPLGANMYILGANTVCPFHELICQF